MHPSWQRKRVKPSPSKHEPQKESPILEINLEGKKLTDAGLAELVPGLHDALTSDSTSAITRLFINLSANELTVAALIELVQCLQLSTAAVEELDLSQNAITVKTDNDAQHWQTFLSAFAKCSSLRKLDLSRNDLSGAKAFEVFCRIYFTQFKLNARAWDYSRSPSFIGGSTEQDSMLHQSVAALTLRDENIPRQQSSTSLTAVSPTGPKKSLGLPCVRVISFDDCSITDAGALFLSYVIERHRWVQNELFSQIWGPPVSEPDHSVISTIAIEKIGNLGAKILSLAEHVPYHPFGALPMELEDTPSPPSSHATLAVSTR